MDALLAKMKGQQETVNVWDFARPEPLGPNLDLSSIGITTFTDGTGFEEADSPPTITYFGAGPAGITVVGGWAVGADSVVVRGFTQNITQLYAGDYVQLGTFLYMLTDDAVATDLNLATLVLNRELVEAVSPGAVPVFTRASTPMQLIDDDQPNRSVGVAQVYEFTASFVESFF